MPTRRRAAARPDVARQRAEKNGPRQSAVGLCSAAYRRIVCRFEFVIQDARIAFNSRHGVKIERKSTGNKYWILLPVWFAVSGLRLSDIKSRFSVYWSGTLSR